MSNNELYNRKVKFHDFNNELVIAEVVITNRNKYNEFTMCTETPNGSGQSDFKPKEGPQLDLHNLWDNLHLKEIPTSLEDMIITLDTTCDAIEEEEKNRFQEETSLEEIDDDKIIALGTYLGLTNTEMLNDIEDVSDRYRSNVYSYSGIEYLVCTDEEANETCADYIKDSLWAFNPDFIIQHSKALDYDKGSYSILKAIQNECESGNDAVERLIDDIDEFVEDAIDADGRGHFLNNWNGEEDEETINGITYYIYRA